MLYSKKKLKKKYVLQIFKQCRSAYNEQTVTNAGEGLGECKLVQLLWKSV
jgi:hypothetical protein